MTWFDAIRNDPVVDDLLGRIAAGGATRCRGAAGSSTAVLAAALRGRTERPFLLVLAHLDDVDEAHDELAGLGVPSIRFPAMEQAAGEGAAGLDLLAERLAVMRRLADGTRPEVIIAPIAALMQILPAPERLDDLHREIRPGDRLELDAFAAWLDGAGYRRVEVIDGPGEFAVRGGIIDLLTPGAQPARIDLFGDEVEAINEIDLATMGSDRRLDVLSVVAAEWSRLGEEADPVHLAQLVAPETAVVLGDLTELNEQARSYLERVSDDTSIVAPSDVLQALGARCAAVVEVDRFGVGRGEGEEITLPVGALRTFEEGAKEAVGELIELAAGQDVHVLCQNDGETARMTELLTEADSAGAIAVRTQYLHRGFTWETASGAGRSLVVVPYHELLHRFQTRRRFRRHAGARAMDAFLDVQPGDHVVHRDHGIGRFVGLQALDKGGEGAAEEYLTLEFSGSTRMHVPASKIELVQKYVGGFSGTPVLSTVGGKRWSNQKEKVAEAVRDLASEMLRIQAARESLPGIRYPEDTTWQREFEAEFPYEETDDQLLAAGEVKKDMSGARPMDRLLCGDVGFGKTEVAIRAAFKCAEYGKQVVVLVPTTWLAEQHERTFRQRFADYPFRIESLSRFKTTKEQKTILEAVGKGQVDIVIGTHRLLSKDVHFADLGLVIIDEEQRFGVEHKQRLLAFRATADVLTMTATPIPRTLHMSMLGLRDISSLTTPPLDRRAIVTELLSYDDERIRRALRRELAREGQVFFVHNRVHDIHDVANDLKVMVPDARIIVGHGQMPTRQLESVMRTFVGGGADILVSTTIIESGVDIPTANTMFIHNAHMFGLSELHQLRGRVGRHKHRAYCYLLLDPGKTISPDALKRLRALESFSMLGSGFKIALRDLEIRGAGNLLGAEQSGHISAVGYEMYCQLLERAVGKLQNKSSVEAIDSTVDLGITGTLPKGYIPSDQRRMDAYRRISRTNDTEQLQRIEHDIVSAYGPLPKSATRLVQLAAIRIAVAGLGVATVTRRDDDIVFRTRRPRDLDGTIGRAKGSLRLVGQPDGAGISEVYYRPPRNYLETDTLLAILRKHLVTSAPVLEGAAV